MNFARTLKYMLIDLKPIDRLFWENRYWRAKERDDRFKGYHLLNENDESVSKFISFEALYAAVKTHQAKIEYGYHTAEKSLVRRLFGNKKLKDFSLKKQDIARHKELIVGFFEEYVKEENGMPTREELKSLLVTWNNQANVRRSVTGKQTAKNSNKGVKVTIFNAPNARTFFDYYNEYLAVERDIRIFLPRHSGPGKHHRLHNADPASLAIWTKHALGYADSRKPTMKQQRDRCISEITFENERRTSNRETELLTIPGRKQFENIIKRLDKFHVMAARHGHSKAMAKYRGQMKGFDIERPGERVEFDSYLMEVHTWLMIWDLWDKLDEPSRKELKPIRVYLNVARDAGSGYLNAVTSSVSENSEAIIQTLDMALSDKSHISRYVGADTDWYGGTHLQTAYSDNGAGYIADATHDAFREANVSLTHPPAGQPWHRGFVESMLFVISRTILSNFDGRTFANVVEKGDYKSEERASLTVNEAVSLIIRALLDHYHHQINPRTMKSPHNAWVEYLEQTGAQWGLDVETRISVFGFQSQRVIHAEGIYVWGIRYQSTDLQKLRMSLPISANERVQVRYHRDDLRWISVCGNNGEWFLVQNRVGVKEQITADEWILARRSLEADAKEAQIPMLPRMMRAVADIASSADVARIRARLDPPTMSQGDYAQIETELFDEIKLYGEDENQTPQASSSRIATPRNPLQEGGVEMSRPGRERAMLIPPKPKTTQKKSKSTNANSKTSGKQSDTTKNEGASDESDYSTYIKK